MCRWDDDDGRFGGTEVADDFGHGGDGEYGSEVVSGEGNDGGGVGDDGGGEDVNFRAGCGDSLKKKI